MSAVNFNDYVNYNTGYDFSALMGGTANSSGSLLSDYASVKNGSYGKLLKAYYAKQDSENASMSGDSRQKLTLMRSSAYSLKKSADALNNYSLWEKKKIKKKDEETGEEIEVEDYDWDSITKAGSLSNVAVNAAAKFKGATYTSNGRYSDTLSQLFSGTLDKKVGYDKDTSSNKSSKSSSKITDKKEDEEKRSKK